MVPVLDVFPDLSPDLGALTAAAVYAVVLGFVFVESGLLVGFLLPGDSDPVRRRPGVRRARVGGVARRCSPPARSPPPSPATRSATPRAPGSAAAGWTAGRPPAGWTQRHLRRAEQFYARWGWWAVVVARWIPWVRTFTPIVAGHQPDAVPAVPVGQRRRRAVLGRRPHGPGSPRGRARRRCGTRRTPSPRCSSVGSLVAGVVGWLRVRAAAGSSVADVGRHTVPGTGTPEPDRGFWVRLAVAAVVVLLVGGYFLTTGRRRRRRSAPPPVRPRRPSATQLGLDQRLGSSSSPAPATTTAVADTVAHQDRPAADAGLHRALPGVHHGAGAGRPHAGVQAVQGRARRRPTTRRC